MKKSIVTLLICLLASVTFAQSIPQTGLVGWWRAEGNAQDSAGRHDGTLPFGMDYAPGKVGQAFDFDGSRRRVSIPDSPDFRLTKSLTIAGWIYPRQYGGIIFFRGDDRPALDPWQVDLRRPGFVGFQIMDSQNQTVRIEAPIQLNRWQHVAATFGTRGNLKLYVNGKQLAETNTTIIPLGELEPTQNPALGIGNIGGTAYQEPFNGMLDELALYSRALSPRQVHALYQAAADETAVPAGGLTFREVRYDGRLSDDEARFSLGVDVESLGDGSAPLLAGDVAVLPARLPSALKIIRDGNSYRLVASRRGHFQFTIEVVARIQRDEPWDRISFTGPAAAIASVAAQAGGTNTEVQLLAGTLLEAIRTNGISRVTGCLGADQTVALRWQGKIAEVARKALLTVDSTVSAQITPNVIKYTSRFRYDIVQGNAGQLTLQLPATQALTRLEGDQIRDWHTVTEGEHQVLTVEFIKPMENACDVTLYSEQAVGSNDSSPGTALNPPQPLNVDRESGSLTLSAEDMLVEIKSLTGLRQVNAPDNAIAAYRFNARPFTLAVGLKPVEPVVTAADRVNMRLEETRQVVAHSLTLDVKNAGIYTLELTPQSGFDVADVHGEGVEDWKVSDGRLQVSFSSRVLGRRQLDVQLEQALKPFPDRIRVLPMRVTGATKETAQIGAASAPGIRLRTAELTGLREIPANRLTGGGDEILAYTTEQPDWQLAIASEKLAARVVADVFNLITIGDGVVGGSATIRYSLVNQGVQEIKVRVPARFKNVEFTGPNIRRKEITGGAVVGGASYPGPVNGDQSGARSVGSSETDTNDMVWTIGLQDKVWGGYTLVVTYDYPFDSAHSSARLPVGGIHSLDVERETGSIAITTAASLRLSAQTVSDTLRRVDESELSAADRMFISRAVVLAWQYTGSQYDLALDVQRYETEPVLEAVADRTQITSVLTDSGEMLTQASFMVKNNDKQFQRFQLPKDAKLWSCYVNGQPAKPERNGDGVLVPLPRDVDRNQAFAVDIVYAQTDGALAAHWSKELQLDAPRTDVPNTYAQWQLLVPPGFRLSEFGGSMNIAQGTTYGLLDGWEKFLAFYGEVLRAAGGAILFLGFLAVLVIALVIAAVRHGWNGVLTLFAVMAILAVLGAMLLPALATAKRKAQRINSVSNLKQIGVATRMFADDNNNRLPVSFNEMTNILETDQVTYDTETGQRYTYLGAGMALNSLKPDSVLAYSPIVEDHCEVLYADGSVAQITAGQFAQLSQRGLVQQATPEEMAAEQQRQAIAHGQFVAQTPAAAMSLSGGGSMSTVGYSGGGGGGGAPATVQASTGVPAAEPPPVASVAGIHSLRIELPQTGQPFLFTKVLNIGDEPLSIRARIMSLHTFQTIQMVWQTAAFLLGLAVWGWQWRRTEHSSFIVTVALALIIGSVGSLLVQWRALHDALIIGFPVVMLAVMAWLIWRYWPRAQKLEAAGLPPAGPSAPGCGLPPVTAAIALLLALSLTSASAANSKLRTPNSEPATIASANYSGTVNDRVALLQATLQFSSAAAGQTIPLFGGDVAVQEFTVKSGRAELVRAGDGVAARLESRGTVTLQVRLLVKIAGDVTKRRLAFGIPPALSSQVALALDESGVDVEFPTAISFQRILDKDRTRVEAVVGSGDRIELLWTPRVKRAAEVAATVFCRNASLVTFGGGTVNVRATLDYQITQGELRQARIQLPPGQRLLRVEGKDIRTWDVSPASAATLAAGSPQANSRHAGEMPALPEAQILVVDLLKGASASWRLTVETEKSLTALPVSEPVTVPHVLEVKRETGLVALQGTEELGLLVESTSGLERVDAAEFTSANPALVGRLFNVFRFAAPDFALRVRAETIQPEVEAVTRNNFRVSTEQVMLSATIDYTIKRTGLFALRIALPDGYRVEHVTGDNILQQAEHTDGSRQVWEVTLKDRTSGAYSLGMELTRSFKELPKSLAIAGVHPLDTAKLTGFVAVSAEPGVAVKTESFDGLTEIPAVSLPGNANATGSGNVLAFKFISAAPKSTPDWQLSLITEIVAAWVRAEIVDSITFSETLVSGRAVVRYDIANAPLKELRVRVPDAFKNLEITGPNIRSREQDGDLWRVELQSPVQGSYTLTATWDQPRPAKAEAMPIAGVTAEGVERETGLLVISARAPLQVSELNTAELQRADASDVPDWAGAPDAATALVYHYVRPGYKLALDVRRFDEAEVLQALVDNAQFTSVMADDGQMMTEMSLSVRNNGRQFLEVGLPAGARVWSAFVAGQPVRPSSSGGKILLPIQQSGVDDGVMSVELTYVATNTFPRTRGAVEFVSPQFDVPLKNARWEVYLPPDYGYRNFDGTMSREMVASPEVASRSFSFLDYSRMEQVNKEQIETDVRRDVDEARRQLASGNVREASVNFDRAKVKAAKGMENGDDVKQLEKDLQNAQASNLINAQTEFSWRNNGQAAGEVNAPAPAGSPGLLYDAASAQQQWTKLQQAQEIVAAQIKPLHVNLPVRGAHFAFTQVLQTEPGKSMTIQMQAVNTQTINWPTRILMLAAAFLVLWGMVALVSRLMARTRIA